MEFELNQEITEKFGFRKLEGNLLRNFDGDFFGLYLGNG